MKLAFIPGELFLNRIEDGSYLLILKGHEIFRTRVSTQRDNEVQ